MVCAYVWDTKSDGHRGADPRQCQRCPHAVTSGCAQALSQSWLGILSAQHRGKRGPAELSTGKQLQQGSKLVQAENRALRRELQAARAVSVHELLAALLGPSPALMAVLEILQGYKR